jgi:class 3 adenylate cyclase/tetratricopeptide (TPR) repeat protein
MGCGAALADSPQGREERKVVSVLFCDLVGSTSSAHNADPEDVRRALQAYHRRLRDQIERFGGRVEKFIGDAVVGVWGVPRAHEDDAERAVRAALAILEGGDEEVRIAVNTGDVLAPLDPNVDPGEGIIGDVMNTAARLQGQAPTGGVLAGETTVHLTRNSIEYAERDPVIVKGKPEGVPVWQVIAARPNSEVRGRSSDSPFVGRESELHVLRGVFQRAVDEPGAQLIGLVGEPGIGKSRLVHEFECWIDEHETSVVRRRGRCLAYGDGVGFWPLSEIVKQHLGLTETDPPNEAEQRLDAAVQDMMDGPWIRARLAPLVGLPGGASAREEAFAAWQQFFDEIASRTPLVLILEDLHWADPAMLDFVQHLVEWSTGVPLVVVCTARPELFEAHPHWAGGLTNATTLALRPLENDATSSLAAALLGPALASTDVEAALVRRCGGNPLYAEEYARLLSERSAAALDTIDMPETVQALIAARIDTLPAERKALIHDAAVIGQTFWAGAAAELGGLDVSSVRLQLHELARKELIRRVRISTVPGDEEYSFWHDLVHQVAYEQIPRADRAEKHRRAAAWIERTSGERLGDRAELLAHHFCEAMALPTDAVGADDDLRRNAVHYLAMAGTRAIGLDAAHAERLLLRGLELTVDGDPERCQMLCQLGGSRVLAGDYDAALEILGQARAEADALGDNRTLAETYFQQSEAYFFAGDGERVNAVLEEAIQRLDQAEPTGAFALVLGNAAFSRLAQNATEASGELVERALRVATQTGDRGAFAMATDIRGLLRMRLGDERALEDLQQAVEIFTGLGSTYTTMSKSHLGGGLLFWYGPERAASTLSDAIADGVRTRNATYEIDAIECELERLFDQGRWNDVLKVADATIARSATGDSRIAALDEARLRRAHVLALRSETDEALQAIDGVVERARVMLGYDPTMFSLGVSGQIELSRGNLHAARDFAQRILPSQLSRLMPLAEVCRLAIDAGAPDHARLLLEGKDAGPPRSLHHAVSARAYLAEADGDHEAAVRHYGDATTRWRSFGQPFELAHALAGGARCLTAVGRGDEAAALNAEARAIFAGLGARGPALGRAVSARSVPS